MTDKRLLQRRRLIFLVLLVCMAAPAIASEKPVRIAIETSMGSIVAELTAAKTPVTVKNFLGYVRDGFFDGTLFHRVIRGFMIQGGGYDTRYRKKPTRPPIENEAEHALPNKRGTLAMARTSNPHSATAQFFINTADNHHLDFNGPSATTWGYATFGQVVKGMDVVDRIEATTTGQGGPFRRDVPQHQVIIKNIRIVSP